MWAYQPHPQQTAGWKPDQISEHARLRALTQRRVMVGGRLEKRFFHDRNALMLADAEVVIAVRDPRITSGGTVAALRELAARRPVITIDVASRVTSIAGADPLFD